FGILRARGPERLLVAARATPSWLPDGAELLLDDPPSRGPLSGLAKALAAMRTTHLIALAIDMPSVTSEELDRICRLAQTGCGVVPMIHDRAEPLAAVYPAEALPYFTSALAGNDFSLQGLIRKLAAEQKVTLHAVAVEREHLYRSANEPGDL